MQNKTLRIVLTGIVILFFLIGCDSSSSTGNDEPEGPAIEAETIEVPEDMENSQDPMAQMTMGYIQTANSITDYTGYLIPPENSQRKILDASSKNGSPWEYTWSDGNLTVTLTITEYDEKYEWVVVFDGTQDEYEYDNWTFIVAEEQKDGSGGNVTVYQPVTDDVGMYWTWYTDSEDVLHLTAYNYWDDSNYKDEDSRVEITSNPDNSGMLEYYEDEVINFKAEWQVDGSGQWWLYDDGEVTQSGSWN